MIGTLISRLREDVGAAMEQDPAARSALEVLLAYPGVHALWMHRAAHVLWGRGLRLGPRLLSHVNRFLTGIEIHPGATVGRRVFIDHGMGVVIGETAEVGDDCVIFKGVVLGGVSRTRSRRHPKLGPHVVIGSNACVLGAIEIGEGARVGSGSVVIRDVPPGATVVGIPGRIVTGKRQLTDAGHADLPDPIAEALYQLAARMEKIESKLEGRPEGGTAHGTKRVAPKNGLGLDDDSHDDTFDGAVEGRRDWSPRPVPSKRDARRKR